MFKIREYSKNSEHSGFTFHLSSLDNDRPSEKSCNYLTVRVWSHFWHIQIPELIKPKRIQQKEYNNTVRRMYGLSIDDTALYVYYGIQPGSWNRDDQENSDHCKVYFLPWNQTDRVQYDFLNPDGTLFMKATDKPNGACDMDAINKARDYVPKIIFKFNDFDGTEVTATCYREIMRWEYGTGLFKWVKWFRKPIISNSLSIQYDKEVGQNKSSWKGGLIGHSIDILEGETPLDAFKRYGAGTAYVREHGQRPCNYTNIQQIQ